MLAEMLLRIPTTRAAEVLRRELEDEVDLIDLDGEFFDLEVELVGDRAKGLCDPHPQLRFAEPTPGFRAPDQVGSYSHTSRGCSPA